MAAPTLVPYTNNYKFGRGKLLFNRKRTDGSYEGFRPLGNCPGFTVDVSSEKFQHFSSEGGLREKDLEFATQIDRVSEITCDNMSKENLELFLAAVASTKTQAATPVTAELIVNPSAGRTFQLGATTSNPAGVRGVSSVVVSSAAGLAATAWAATTAYALGAVKVPTVANGRWYIATVAGTSAGSQPTWPTNLGTVVDGTVTWRDLGPIAYALTTDYTLDTTLGLLNVLTPGAIASAISLLPSGSTLTLSVNYTPAANSRTQIATTGSVELSGELKFIADNPQGTNEDAYFPAVTLAPSGSLPFITENELASVTFSVGVNVRDSLTAAIYIDGRAA